MNREGDRRTSAMNSKYVVLPSQDKRKECVLNGLAFERIVWHYCQLAGNFQLTYAFVPIAKKLAKANTTIFVRSRGWGRLALFHVIFWAEPQTITSLRAWVFSSEWVDVVSRALQLYHPEKILLRLTILCQPTSPQGLLFPSPKASWVERERPWERSSVTRRISWRPSENRRCHCVVLLLPIRQYYFLYDYHLINALPEMQSNESTAWLPKLHWFGMEQQLCHECPVTNPTG